MSGGGVSIDKAVVFSRIVRLLKRLTFVSPVRWLRAGNQVDGDGQKSLTTDNIIPIRDANSTTNKLVGYESELRFSNKRRISASSIHSLDSERKCLHFFLLFYVVYCQLITFFEHLFWKASILLDCCFLLFSSNKLEKKIHLKLV
ncbi:hypothetical protein Smp_141620 [Schistosoma mansoni]|uniref:Transmembrane protein n=1 Tax=Schistosoma mansoni TaxID=6183 RepID=G4M143_SCHMA|nr:hypothetical protein Smp_141620 [Schistosoma mansoni]|eukprot:XP_018647208.1 hypothetical protein Smp_141620 [Schistosoma mansoni]